MTETTKAFIMEVTLPHAGVLGRDGAMYYVAIATDEADAARLVQRSRCDQAAVKWTGRYADGAMVSRNMLKDGSVMAL